MARSDEEKTFDAEQEGRRSSGVPLEQRRAQRRESRASQTFKAFLKDVCGETGLDEQAAEKASVSVLCALEQRIMRDEAEDLEAQLPLKLRELIQQCDLHLGERPERFGKDEFLARVKSHLGEPPGDIEHIVRGVISALRSHISEGEAEQVRDQLPADLRLYWQPVA